MSESLPLSCSNSNHKRLSDSSSKQIRRPADSLTCPFPLHINCAPHIFPLFISHAGFIRQVSCTAYLSPVIPIVIAVNSTTGSSRLQFFHGRNFVRRLAAGFPSRQPCSRARHLCGGRRITDRKQSGSTSGCFARRWTKVIRYANGDTEISRGTARSAPTIRSSAGWM